MARRVRLDLFDLPATMPAAADATVVLTGDALEEAKLAAFEQGYQAGWDDATTARDDEGERLRQDVGRSLQALSFTYHEAHGQLMSALAPLFDRICATLLPGMAHAALGGLVQEALAPLAEAALDRPVTLVTHPDARVAVEAALDGAVTPPWTLVEDGSLTPGQVWLRWETDERRIDVDAATEAIRAAVTAFFTETEEELRRHG